MKIKHLKLNSFRGIGGQTISFEDGQPTIFMGINGIGKSSILESISILLSWLVARIQNPKGNGRYFKDEDITWGHKAIFNEITILDEEFLQPVKWSLSHTAKGRRKESSSEFLELREFVTRIQDKLQVNPAASLPIFIYYPTNRAVIDIPLRIRKRHDFEQINAYDRALTGGQIAFREFFEWFRQREDLENELRAHKEPEYKDKQLQAVRLACESFLSNFSNLRVRRTPPLRMTVEKQGITLSINQLSDGEKCLLAMVGDLAKRLAIANPELENPLYGEGIVLIDEIELHLHPKWQHSIIKRLTETFKNCQFIITTYSPLVATNIEWVSLLKDSPQGAICERVRSYGKDINRILETLMESSERQIDIQNQINQLFNLIDENKLDDARNLRRKIADELQEEDPKLVRADWLIQRKELLQR